jgi:tetratricopeptide (TPR) repeat protein
MGRIKSLIRFLIAFSLTVFVCFLSASAIALIPPSSPIDQRASANAQALEQSGKVEFDARRFRDAVIFLEQAVQAYQVENNQLGESIALGNLASAYQQLGQWQDAERSIAQSLKLSENNAAVLSQVLETQGSLQFAQGQVQSAWDTWEQAAQLYQQVDDRAGIVRSRINQAQALQRLGRYRRAIETLTDLAEILRSQPDSLEKVIALRSLGDAFRVAGSLVESERVLQQSLGIAQVLGSTIAEVYLSLGNIAYAQENVAAALEYYKKADQVAVNPDVHLSSQLNQLSLLIDQQQWSTTMVMCQTEMTLSPVGMVTIT